MAGMSPETGLMRQVEEAAPPGTGEPADPPAQQGWVGRFLPGLVGLLDRPLASYYLLLASVGLSYLGPCIEE